MEARNPLGVQNMEKQTFAELGIDPGLLKAIESLGFEQPSPIQAQAIPVALAGRDVVGQSQTGSGKTMAFGIPVVQKIDPNLRAIQALILCPTRTGDAGVLGDSQDRRVQGRACNASLWRRDTESHRLIPPG